MQTDHVEPSVLAALEQDVVHDQRGAVPVVVAERPLDTGGAVDRPEHEGLAASVTIRRHDPEPAVAGARVVQREPVRVRRRRALREVAGRERLPQRQARQPVQEVVHAVVGALADLDRAVLAHDDVRLSRPAGPAPLAPLDAHERHRAEPGRGSAPPDHRVQRHGPLAVIAARRVASERDQTLERRVDRGRALRRPIVPERATAVLLVLDPGQEERDQQDGDPDHEGARHDRKDGEPLRHRRPGRRTTRTGHRPMLCRQTGSPAER